MISKIKFLSSMMIFGTIGIFVRHIDLPSSEIALLRGFIGSVFLLMILLLLRQKISFEKIKKNLFILTLSGIALGFNWIFLFQAYKNTTISNAALSYYFAPVFLMILASAILKEKFSIKKAVCICAAMIGMFLIISSAKTASTGYNNILGVTYGLIAAGFYASLMLLNKFIKELDGLGTTLIQLSISCIILLPYVLITQGFNIFQMQSESLIYLIILGVVHTGLGFYLFFSGMQNLKAQSIAVLSYADPITSVLISALILREGMSFVQIAGAALLLGAIFISEKTVRRNKMQEQA